MKYADLHLHTHFSDGTFSPAQLISLAAKAGLQCISITDHDSVDAYSSLPAQGGVEIVPGIELTADIDNVEVHILGYFIDYQQGWLRQKLKEICLARIKRVDEMCRKLMGLGIAIEAGEVLEFAGNASVGRLHLARLMVKKGLVAGSQEAFNRFIGEGRPAYVSKFRFSPQEVIELIRKAKGIPVLAHPYSLSRQELIPEFVNSGLMGLEVIYPEHTPKQIKLYGRLAKEYGLLVTGGSDCHGQAKPEVKIGMVKVPYELVEKLRTACLK